jgi:hypothetical protein
MFWSARGGAGVALGIAGAVAVLTVPRPEYPDAVPYPPIDEERTRIEIHAAQRSVEQALSDGLDVAVRGVGERVRRCGVLEVTGPQSELELEVRKLREAVLLLVGERRIAELVRLRELQAALLHRGIVAKWSGRGAENVKGDLAELGANLEQHLRPHRDWLQDDPYFRHTVRALFLDRWANLTGMSRHMDLMPTANDWRLIHRFRVMRLIREGQAKDMESLRTVLDEVPKYSPEYPVDYARGIVFYRMGAFGDAVDAFSRHLAAYPDSDWAVRAQNFRLEAARALVE